MNESGNKDGMREQKEDVQKQALQGWLKTLQIASTSAHLLHVCCCKKQRLVRISVSNSFRAWQEHGWCMSQVQMKAETMMEYRRKRKRLKTWQIAKTSAHL